VKWKRYEQDVGRTGYLMLRVLRGETLENLLQRDRLAEYLPERRLAAALVKNLIEELRRLSPEKRRRTLQAYAASPAIDIVTLAFDIEPDAQLSALEGLDDARLKWLHCKARCEMGVITRRGSAR
jgi:hypothetical protein